MKDRPDGAGSGGEAASTPPAREQADDCRDARATLLAALAGVGVDPATAVVLCDAATVVGAISSGRRVGSLQLGLVRASAAGSSQPGVVPGARSSSGAGPAPGSMEAWLAEADVALTAVEVIAECSARLDAALVVAASQQTAAIGGALLAERDVSDPGELSTTARERWRARAKRRAREEITPATGWTPGETVHLVAVATAPAAFRAPVLGQMAAGVLPWRLARSLWRACEGLSVAEAGHVAAVMCGDNPDTCVPERLDPDGRVRTGPWEHRAFYAALDREVAKLTHADDSDPADRRLAREARAAALQGRRVLARVDEDGTGSLTVITSALWVAAIKDRLAGAARAARGAGDARTLAQLESDIARTLLAHATVGFADGSPPTGGTHPATEAAHPTTGVTLPSTEPAHPRTGLPTQGQDPTQHPPQGPPQQGKVPLEAPTGPAAWTPQLQQALSGLPPATLQVVVPLIGLHDPAAAATLPAVGRVNAVADGTPRDAAGQGHTGRAGCPRCLPSARRSSHHPGHGLGHDPARTEGHGHDRAEKDDPGHGQGHHPARAEEDIPDHTEGHDPPRRVWVGELLGSFRTFVSPEQVRELALTPGTTMARLLVDPADGRCVERSIASYQMDTAMRAQLLAADVTCRAPGCTVTGVACQVDHVTEHGTPGGVTSEANGQLLHTGHHDPKTAKHWDAHLAANRDVTWTSLLGRLYRTRSWDYRRYVTLLVDALDDVRDAGPADREGEMDRQIYLALTHRDLGEHLWAGDDDLEPDLVRYAGWPLIQLTHRDRQTGERVPGPSAAATAEALARQAAAGAPPSPTPDSTDNDGLGRGRSRRGQLSAGAEGTERNAERDPSPGAGQRRSVRAKTSSRPEGLQAMTHLGEDTAARAAWRLMSDEDIPPF